MDISNSLHRAIILNGTSSSGKTTLAKSLQSRLGDCFFHFEMDSFWDMVPNQDEANSEKFPNLKSAFILSARALLDTGHDLILDTVFMPDTLQDLKTGLGNHDVYTIGVMAPLDVLENRELARADRLTGLAKSQFPTLHDGTEYDLTVDTSEQSADEIATSVVHHYTKRVI